MRKKLDEVIEALEHLVTCDDTGCSYIEDDDAAEALHYLQEYRERKENYKDAEERHHAAYQILEARMKWKAAPLIEPPLTWGGLKAREGEPVWLEEYGPQTAEWVLVHGWNDDQIWFTGVDGLIYSLEAKFMGKTWAAYAKERKQ